ncbi:histone deacetylase [Caulobacter henricii]|uniref:Histone deacetylase n=1 Tax=Caulobacter henricii TaxID=69395 RepID=A0A0P0P341_9CAUL|nr:histone deacetylase [Caulobacter henricii]ALL14999.1 histone deacetylase [Caulobacter henricii]
MSPPIVHHPAFRAEMPEGHRFPMDKFSRLAAVLVAEALTGPEGFHRPDLIDLESLLLVHDEAYVHGVLDLTLPADIVRRIGLPNSESVATRARAATGGTLLTARLALEHGLACNTAGGSHHAAADSGAGFCVFNDVAVAARRLLHEGAIGKALVVDLDVHQGDGTARIFADDSAVFTFSMHAEKNFPARKAVSDLDVELADGTGDAAYLAKLADILPALLDRERPDLVFFNAGVDPHADDKLGRLSLSDEGLARREAYVLDCCLARRIPLAGVIGGGYDPDLDRLAQRHAILHRAAQQACLA